MPLRHVAPAYCKSIHFLCYVFLLTPLFQPLRRLRIAPRRHLTHPLVQRTTRTALLAVIRTRRNRPGINWSLTHVFPFLCIIIYRLVTQCRL